MGAYELLKDAAKAAQKADNIALYGQIMEAQQAVLDLQEKQLRLQADLSRLSDENAELKSFTDLVFDPEYKFVIDPLEPDIELCPVCANRDHFKSPLRRVGSYKHYCNVCRWTSTN